MIFEGIQNLIVGDWNIFLNIGKRCFKSMLLSNSFDDMGLAKRPNFAESLLVNHKLELPLHVHRRLSLRAKKWLKLE